MGQNVNTQIYTKPPSDMCGRLKKQNLNPKINRENSNKFE